MTEASDQQLQEILNTVRRHLSLWDIPSEATLRIINISENITFLVEAATSFKAVLRLHRQGYHSYDEILSELQWVDALRDDKVLSTASVIRGKNGKLIQTLSGNSSRFMVLFQYIAGQMPDENSDLPRNFRKLGEIAAKSHLHAIKWPRSRHFQRKNWDLTTVFSQKAIWGNWRDAPNINAGDRATLEEAETLIVERLTGYGKSADKFNLIHADMRLANLIVDGSTTHVIDFDDCGFGWFMYDFAAAISFFEDSPLIPTLKRAWLNGYRQHRTLKPEDEDEINTFIMLRRMALLAWIGSHMEAPEPQHYAPNFARVSAGLAREWLTKNANK